MQTPSGTDHPSPNDRSALTDELPQPRPILNLTPHSPPVTTGSADGGEPPAARIDHPPLPSSSTIGITADIDQAIIHAVDTLPDGAITGPRGTYSSITAARSTLVADISRIVSIDPEALNLLRSNPNGINTIISGLLNEHQTMTSGSTSGAAGLADASFEWFRDRLNSSIASFKNTPPVATHPLGPLTPVTPPLGGSTAVSMIPQQPAGGVHISNGRGRFFGRIREGFENFGYRLRGGGNVAQYNPEVLVKMAERGPGIPVVGLLAAGAAGLAIADAGTSSSAIAATQAAAQGVGATSALGVIPSFTGVGAAIPQAQFAHQSSWTTRLSQQDQLAPPLPPLTLQ